MTINANQATELEKRRLADFGIKWVFVEVTNHCNMHCRFCPSDCLRRARRFMDFATFRRVVDELAELVPPHPISLHVLGEPLLHREVFRFIDTCGERGLRVYLFTNGLIVDRKIAEICRRDNVEALVVSVQTPTEASFTLRGCAKSFRDYMNGIWIATDFIVRTGTNRKMRVEYHLANTREMAFRDWDALEDHARARAVFRNLGLKLKYLDRKSRGEPCDIRTLGRLLDEDFESIPKEILDTGEWNFWGYEAAPNLFVRLKRFGTFGGPACLLPDGVEVREKTGPAACEMARTNLCVLADGAVTMCCEDSEGETRIGHMDAGGIAPALCSARRQALLDDVTSCATCRRCMGEVRVGNGGSS